MGNIMKENIKYKNLGKEIGNEEIDIKRNSEKEED
jgi:hypothetical protein